MNCRARVDENSCSGHGDCVDVAPSIFRPDDDIAEARPAAAISVLDIETGEQIFPLIGNV